ncbi:MAG: protein-tyrosine phosphatase family protein, partial [Phototrophicaceae bacterium]
LENGHYPTGDAHTLLKQSLGILSNHLDEGENIVIHCAAGIHRTGMLAYAVLRYRGYSAENAMRLIAQMRQHTHDGLQSQHIRWAEDALTPQT